VGFDYSVFLAGNILLIYWNKSLMSDINRKVRQQAETCSIAAERSGAAWFLSLDKHGVGHFSATFCKTTEISGKVSASSIDQNSFDIHSPRVGIGFTIYYRLSGDASFLV